MSNERRGARQTGAPALTLTRRQQKRARKQKYQRRTAPPAARQTATAQTATAQTAQQKTQRASAQQMVVVGTTARETMPAAESATRPVRAQQRRENVTPEPKEVKRREKREAAAQPEKRQDDVKRRPALRAVQRDAAVSGTRDEMQPATGPLKVSKRTRPIPTMRVARAVDAPSASGRRYPTLAHMAVAKQRPEPEDSGQARDAADLLPWEIGVRQQAKPQRIWTAPNGGAPVGSSGEQATAQVSGVASQAQRPARQAVPTRRLRDEMEHAREAQPPRGESRAKIRVPRVAWPAPLPRVDLTVSVAVAHAGIAAAAALTGAGMLVLGAPGALWPLSLMAIAGAGGWLAYALAQRGDMRRIAGVVLLVSQLAALGWLLALLGPRAALLAVVPALALLALRTGGRGAAIGAGAALALFAGYTVLTLNGLLTPGVRLDAGAQALVDVVAVAAGLGATLYAALRVASDGSRVEAAAQARLHEARLLRARLAQLQQQVEDDGERLDAGLARALHGNGIPPVAAEGTLSPLAETVNATAERLKTLQRDREDRLRLEGAVRAVTRAVERAWLGLPWSWPEWSGTPMDELVALLRTPRPREVQESWSEETPTLLQLPTLDRMMTPPPWESETAPVYPVYPYVAKAANGWSQPLGWQQATGRMPAQAGGQMEQMGQVTPLPWNEWNQWPDWEG